MWRRVVDTNSYLRWHNLARSRAPKGGCCAGVPKGAKDRIVGGPASAKRRCKGVLGGRSRPASISLVSSAGVCCSSATGANVEARSAATFSAQSLSTAIIVMASASASIASLDAVTGRFGCVATAMGSGGWLAQELIVG